MNWTEPQLKVTWSLTIHQAMSNKRSHQGLNSETHKDYLFQQKPSWISYLTFLGCCEMLM